MTEFRVTREIVQEIAELGAIQLPVESIPPFDEFMEAIVTSKDRALEFDISDSPEYLLWGILDNIISIESGGIDSIGRAYIEAHAQRQDIPSKNLHQDRFGQKISCVWMRPTSGEVEPMTDVLHVYGRGRHASLRPNVQFSYRNGPIVLAGYNFGNLIVPSLEGEGYTWHIGNGDPEGDAFFAADIYTKQYQPSLAPA